MDRRDFIQNTATAATASWGVGKLLKEEVMTHTLPLPKGLKILFQGDSITDAGRDRGDYYANSGKGMGGGYVYQIVSDLLGTHPQADLHCFNRGISGHKVFQLAERWDLDCLAIKPDVLSILIGVNDFWHRINGNYQGTAEIYENEFRALLSQTKKELPKAHLIIGEPFAVAGGTAINEKWNDFDAYRAISKKLASEFEAAFVPFHTVFVDALKVAPARYWCPDGVHPSIAGAHLMKNAWLKTFNQWMS